MKFHRILIIAGVGWVVATLAGCATTLESGQTPVVNTVKFTGPALDLSAVDVAPVPIKEVPPIFPVVDQNPGTETTGRAVIAFIVDKDGTVKQAQVERASAVEYGEAALEAVKQWKFKPAMKNGVPVPVRMSFPFVLHFWQPVD